MNLVLETYSDWELYLEITTNYSCQTTEYPVKRIWMLTPLISCLIGVSTWWIVVVRRAQTTRNRARWLSPWDQMDSREANLQQSRPPMLMAVFPFTSSVLIIHNTSWTNWCLMLQNHLEQVFSSKNQLFSIYGKRKTMKMMRLGLSKSPSLLNKMKSFHLRKRKGRIQVFTGHNGGEDKIKVVVDDLREHHFSQLIKWLKTALMDKLAQIAASLSVFSLCS